MGTGSSLESVLPPFRGRAQWFSLARGSRTADWDPHLVPQGRLNANCVNTMSSIGFSPDIADRFQGNSGHGTWPFWALLSPLSGAQGHALSL